MAIVAGLSARIAEAKQHLFSAGSHRRTIYVAAHFALALLVIFACASISKAQSFPTFRLNEVEFSGGSPDDWFELYNYGAAQIDVSGWKMKDNDDTHVFFVFPAGSTIPAGGYLVFDTGAATNPNAAHATAACGRLAA